MNNTLIGCGYLTPIEEAAATASATAGITKFGSGTTATISQLIMYHNTMDAHYGDPSWYPGNATTAVGAVGFPGNAPGTDWPMGDFLSRNNIWSTFDATIWESATGVRSMDWDIIWSSDYWNKTNLFKLP